jgi:hypothetical protein
VPYYVLYLRLVGNAVVPLSDEHPLGALNWAPLYMSQGNLSMPNSG